MDDLEIVVEMANYAFGKAPQTLIARGLGSCVAVTFYHRLQKIGALSHVMLPSSQESIIGGSSLRFMDKMVMKILTAFKKVKIEPHELESKVVGGANMFPFLNQERKLSPSMGERNVAMAESLLKANRISIVGEDVGGNYGRSLRFHLDTGIVTVEKKI